MRVTRPRPGEPIRLVQTRTGSRYRVVLDAGTKSDGRRRQVTKTFSNLADARAFVDETRTRVRRGVYRAPDRMSFNELADAWLASKLEVREVTRLGYAQVLKPVRTLIGTRRAQQVRLPHIESVMRHLATEGGQLGKALSHRSMSFTLMTIKQVFSYGVRAGIVGMNLATGVKVPKTVHAIQEVSVWTAAELVSSRAAADTDTWGAARRLTVAGLRRSEVMGLSWDAVDTAAGTVTVRAGRVSVDGSRTERGEPKSKASFRTVQVESMHPGSAALLRRLSAQQAADRLSAGASYEETGLVLVDALGHPIRPEAYSDRFAQLCREAGVPVIRLHAVRHTVALMLHRAGVAPADAASLLGHSVPVHLATYVPRTQHGLNTAATALGQVLAAAH